MTDGNKEWMAEHETEHKKEMIAPPAKVAGVITNGVPK